MEPTKPAGSMWVWIVLIIVVLIGGGFFAWYYLMGPGKKVAVTATPTPVATNTNSSATSGWLTYTNPAYGYSIQYPSSLSYTEDSTTKNMHFSTTADAAAAAACQARPDTDCNPGNEIYISVDQNAGTTNADDITKTILEIANNRVTKGTLTSGITATTLGRQSAYEGVSTIMNSLYNIVTNYNSHTYDLTINCGELTLAACKAKITPTQNTMISTFTFLP